MYRENDTYNQRNHTSWDQCCLIALCARRYPAQLDTATAPVLSEDSDCDSETDVLLNSGESRLRYFSWSGTVTRENKRGRDFSDDAESELSRWEAPLGSEMWLGCEEMP